MVATYSGNSMKNTDKPRFLTIEGGEGVGKSSFIAAFAKALQESGKLIITTREPGGTVVAERIRTLFATPPKEEPLQMGAEFLLIAAARAQHVSVKIKPSLASGTWVLCDRFTDSSLVYQGIVGGLPLPTITAINEFACAGLKPDLTLLLDCNPELAKSRLPGRGAQASDGPQRYDEAEMSFHKRIRDGFLQVAAMDPKRIVVLDASLPISANVERALSLI